MSQVLEVIIPYGAKCKADQYRMLGETCTIPFELTDNNGWNTKDVFVYYQLDNFYQNHRRYTTNIGCCILRSSYISY